MSDDLPDFMSEEPASTPEADPQEPNPQEAPAVEAPQEPTAPAAVETPALEPQPEEQPPADPPAPAHAPLGALLDERDRRQAAERRAENAERRLREADVKNRPQVPDRYDDPDGYEQHQRAALGMDLFVQRRDMSRMVAEVQHGAETVKAAFDWAEKACDQDQAFSNRIMGAANPAGLIVQAYEATQRAQKLAEFSPEDITAFQQWKASQAAGLSPAAAGAAPAPGPLQRERPQPPRASLAAAPSAGGAGQPIATDGETTFNDMFAPR